MGRKKQQTLAARVARAATRDALAAAADNDAADEAGDDDSDGASVAGSGDGGGGGGETDVVGILAAMRDGGGVGKRLRASGASSAPPADTSAATRFAIAALQAAVEARIRARQSGWRLPVVVPNSGGAVVAVATPRDPNGHVQRAAVTHSRHLQRSVVAIHSVRQGLHALQAELPRRQAAAVAAIASASVAA